jgi:hypothetical protein
MKAGKGVEGGAALNQLEHGARHIRQVGPLVSDAWRSWGADRAHRFTGFDQALGEPVVGRPGAEKIPGTHDHYTSALAGRLKQALLQLHTYRALAGQRVLG